MTAATPDRGAIITEALRKIDELSGRLEVAQKDDTGAPIHPHRRYGIDDG